MVHILLIAAGGAIGALARYWLSTLVDARLGGGFPWGTLVVNFTGAGVIGLLAGLWLIAGGTYGPVWAFFVIGVLGSYTTVSSFSLQTLELFQAGRIAAAAGLAALSLAGCLMLAAGGYFLITTLAGA
ncbi:CrcB family protein [Glycocaulis sp.]|uniref:CrcB family protein n=1 Tax=Glycocaulis sp. TaxID=1969725 RepID=UPI0025C5AD9C|nr:CrcB family protein [Glycocaulis sp.]MCH8522692.1 CrcB family protein [Glycocaulis sp.]